MSPLWRTSCSGVSCLARIGLSLLVGALGRLDADLLASGGTHDRVLLDALDRSAVKVLQSGYFAERLARNARIDVIRLFASTLASLHYASKLALPTAGDSRMVEVEAPTPGMRCHGCAEAA